MSLLSLHRLISACDAAASTAPDRRKTRPHLVTTSSAPAVPGLVDALVWLQRLQARSHHVHYGLLGIAQSPGRVDLDPAANASALATADIGARRHPFSTAPHAPAPPGHVVSARIWLQRLQARRPHQRCRLLSVGTLGSGAGLDAAPLAAAFPGTDLHQPRRHLAAASGTTAPPGARSMTRIRFQGLQRSSTHVSHGDCCVHVSASAAVLAALTRAAPHHAEPGCHLMTAYTTPASPRVIGAGVRIERLEPGRAHD